MASYKEATGKSIEQAFKEFNQANPKIYELFKEQVLRAQKAGKKKVSSKAIINYIRWEMHIKTTSEDGYKINDAFTAMYARKYVHDYPHNKSLFEFRKRKSIDLTVSGIFSGLNCSELSEKLKQMKVPSPTVEQAVEGLKTFNKARQASLDL